MTAIVGIVARPGSEAVLRFAVALIERLYAKGLEVALSSDDGVIAHLPTHRAGMIHNYTPPFGPGAVPCIVSLGGDGTFLRAARMVESDNTVLVGVNFGSLGFLTEILPDEVDGVIESVLEGSARLGRRALLAVEVRRGGVLLSTSRGLNDVVVQKGAESPLVEVSVTADSEPMMDVRADGVIVATPTGSTAYSLAAGGAIMHRDIPALMVTPLCPHSLTARPVVLPGSVDLTLALGGSGARGEVLVVVDGHRIGSLVAGDTVSIRTADTVIRYARSPHLTYYDLLRKKLAWATR